MKLIEYIRNLLGLGPEAGEDECQTALEAKLANMTAETQTANETLAQRDSALANEQSQLANITAERDALTTRVQGLKVVIARGECQLERQRRLRPENRRRAAAGETVVQPRFGIDPDVCTGDHSCMRFNGCPSLTLRESHDPLREDPIAHVDDTCVGCGVCGEVAHAAVLCPSFYEVRVIANPGWWTRLMGRVRRRIIGALAPA